MSKTQGTSVNPATVMSVGISSTDLSVSGSPITSSGSITLNVNTNAITYAKFQQVAALSLVGNATNALANAAAITAGSDYQILRRSGTALAFGSIDLSQSAAVGSSRLAFANLTQIAGLSVLGVTGTSTDNVAAITGTSNQVLVINGAGTSLAFGQVNLSSPNAVTGTLGEGRGGTGNNSYAVGDLLYASGATTLSKLADVSVGSYLRSGGVTTAPLWSTLKLPNTATQYYVPYATAANTIGESGNLQFSGTNLGIGVAATSKLHILTVGIGVTQNDAYGVFLNNTTAASSGNQQKSPPIVLQGNGWKTTATAASRDVRFRIDVLPVQGTSNPTGKIQIESSINGGAYSNSFTIDTSGIVESLGLSTAEFRVSGQSQNIYAPNRIGGVGSGVVSANYLFAGAASVGMRAAICGNGGQITANESFATFMIANSGVAEGSSGTHALIAQMVIKSLTITNASATTTNTASLYIENAPTGITPTGANYSLWIDDGAIRLDGTTNFNSTTTWADAVNMVFNTSTGTKIGTATSQKIGIWNTTPIVQPTTAIAAATFVANTSAIANDTATFDGYTIGQVVKALRNFGILA